MTARLVRTYTSDWGCFVIPPEITVEMNEPTISWWAHLCNRHLLPAGEPKPEPANKDFWYWLFTQELAAGRLGATDTPARAVAAGVVL